MSVPRPPAEGVSSACLGTAPESIDVIACPAALYSGTSSVVVSRDFALPRSRAYLIDPGVWYFSK